MKKIFSRMRHIPVIVVFPVVIAVILSSLLAPARGADREPAEVVLMTPPFGTDLYHVGAAFEKVFHQADTWVKIKHQETPGSVYMYTYMTKNRENMAAGKSLQTLVIGTTGTLRFVAEGRPPFDKAPWPSVKTLTSLGSLVRLYAAFDEDIHSLEDLAGKRVGTMERSMPFLGLLIDQPLFGKGLGLFDGIEWAPLGMVGGKDALLDGTIDAYPINLGGKIEGNVNDGFVASKLVPNTQALELIHSGRSLRVLEIKKEWIQKGFDFDRDQMAFPVSIRKETLSVIHDDIGGLMLAGVILCDDSLSDDVAEEIIRVRYRYRREFEKYHPILGLMPESPYPLGAPGAFVHPGVYEGLKRLGLAVPE